jgi:hypothetical protein
MLKPEHDEARFQGTGIDAVTESSTGERLSLFRSRIFVIKKI